MDRDLDSAAYKVAEAIYQTAKKNAVTQIQVSINMSTAGLIDNYGHSLEGNSRHMGDLTISKSEIDEIRKYKDTDSYKYNDFNKAYYMLKLSRMNYGYLLKK